MVTHTSVKWLLYGAGALAAFGVLTVALVLIATWVEHRMPLELPSPTGPFTVGRTAFHWNDQGHPDEFAPSSASKRELIVWVWYPSATTPGGGVRAEYLPRSWRDALSRTGGVLMNDFLTRDLSQVIVHSTTNAELSPAQPRYPVVIMRAGLAAQVTEYTVLAEDLASHGYIVVAPDAPYRTDVVVFPDGRVINRPAKYNLDELPESEQVPFATRLMNMWSADIGFVLDELGRLDAADPTGRFSGRLDLQHVGIFGHSLGGATAANFCHEDPRCTAGIDLDGQPFGKVIQDGLRRPFMFILADHSRDVLDPPDPQVIAHIQSIYDRSPVDSRLRIRLVGSNHFSFSDRMLLNSQLLLGTMRRLGVIGNLEGRRGLAITVDYVSTYFDVYLKGRSRKDLDALAQKYAEVSIH